MKRYIAIGVLAGLAIVAVDVYSQGVIGGAGGGAGATGPSGPSGPSGPTGAIPCTFNDPDLDCSAVDATFNSVVVGDGSASLPVLVASGAEALDTDEIASEACDVSTATATGALTTDVILATVNGTPIGVTGYVPDTDGTLYIWVYPTADTANFSVCNQTAGAITPGAITVNWMVLRAP